MILYHGTTSRHLDSIREHGLLPRYDERPTRWDDNPSATDRVYLTNAYAVWFAWTAAEAGEKGVVVAVDVEEEFLVADEDYLAQTNWQDEALAFLQDMSLEQRTLYWKERAPSFPAMAQHSLTNLGTVAHMGPCLDIVKIVEFDPLVAIDHDPTISLMNFRMLGGQYRAMTKDFVESDGKLGLKWQDYTEVA